MAKSKQTAPTSRYQPHPALSREADNKAKFEKKSGRSYDEWVALAQAEGPSTHTALVKWLQETHGMASMHGWWIAQSVLSEGEASYDEPALLVDALYSGAHADKRALNEAIIDLAEALGDDITPTACKTMVPLYRKYVFLEMHPVEDGIVVQLALGDVKTTKRSRLQPASGRAPGDRLTREVRVHSTDDFDDEFRAWLQAAYENGAKTMKRAASAETPDDLATALAASPKATATWDTCTPAMRRDMIQWIESAKQAATREKRIGRALEKLEAGKRRIY